MEDKKKWILVVAARPNFMKVAPLMRVIQSFNREHGDTIVPCLVHTGQHYDVNMSDAFFRDLHLPAPDIHLGVGSGNHGAQTGKVLVEFEKVLLGEKPNLVIVVGDVNSTFACALAAVKLHIPVAHVEAGLRSFDRTMPEEINRILTDAISDYLFTPSPDGNENLLHEGIPESKIFLVGDIMVDNLFYNLEAAKNTRALHRLGLADNGGIHPHRYALLTLHRPANVDRPDTFQRILNGLLDVSQLLPIFLPIHPRTLKQVRSFGMERFFTFHSSLDMAAGDFTRNRALRRTIHCFDPLGYLEFLSLMAHATVVLTDSGGIQEETTVLNVPCITLRDTTERPITLTKGTNVLVHDDPVKMISEVRKVLEGQRSPGKCPPYWDGNTSRRIVDILTRRL